MTIMRFFGKVPRKRKSRARYSAYSIHCEVKAQQYSDRYVGQHTITSQNMNQYFCEEINE
jgi:hypothetical protein